MLDFNQIAYEYYKNPYLPADIYTSGEKEETSLKNAYSPSESLAILTLREDIISPEGYGLKKGFYNVIPDKYLDFLLIYQRGELKAKVPVVKTQVLENQAQEPQKPKKMSQRKYQRYLEKEKKKYQGGINPAQIDYKTVEIEYIKEKEAWLIIYQDDNLVLSGMIKF